MKEDVRETVGLVLLAASMVFVGWEIRQSNVQAKASAYQALGIAVAEYHQNVTPFLDQLYLEAPRSDLVRQWTADDWQRYHRSRTASLRIAETLYLQVEQGLLPQDAIESLGYGPVIEFWLTNPTQVCLWPLDVPTVSPALKRRIEAIPEQQRAICPVDMQALLRDLDREETPRPFDP